MKKKRPGEVFRGWFRKSIYGEHIGNIFILCIARAAFERGRKYERTGK